MYARGVIWFVWKNYTMENDGIGFYYGKLGYSVELYYGKRGYRVELYSGGGGYMWLEYYYSSINLCERQLYDNKFMW